MAIQAALLHDLMAADGRYVEFLPSNQPLDGWFSVFGRIPGFRPVFRSLLLCARLWRTLPRTAVVHVLACSWLYFFFVVWPVVVLCRLRRTRIVMNYHGGEADEFLRSYGCLTRPAFRMADVVTVPSGFLGKVIQSRMQVQTEIVPNIIRCDAFTYRQRRPVRPRMLVTRHLEALYDVEAVIRAFAEVCRSYPDASLQIVGNGSQESHLRGLAASLGLENVVFMGHIPYSDLPGVYDTADILLNASRADNFPGSLVEAAVAGLVIISTGVGGIPYLFEDERSALLVQPGDWAGMAAAIDRVLRNPELASRLTNEAFRDCKRFDWAAVRRSLYAAYGFEHHSSDLMESPVGCAREASQCTGG
jgi:glycosyltransferase involved in cell wall biosynthesis